MTDHLPAPETQILFFLPLVENYTKQLEFAFSKKNKQASSEHEWLFIIDENESGKFPKHYVIEKIWNQFILYLKNESKIYCFIEEQTAGLGVIKSKYWLFFSPKTANDFFTRQLDRPKGFSLKKIITIPFMNILTPIQEKVSTILDDGNSNPKIKISEAFQFLNIAEFYLLEEGLKEFDQFFRSAISFYLLSEVLLLQKDITNPNLSSGIVQKRLQYIFKLCWRYFRSDNELESNYYKKMISVTNSEVIKALKLAEKKIKDFREATKIPSP
ncbi:MAG: hypothetical protein HOD92_04470 [Deltaproteobacteria bacterium]|jgi:hypothetical protein|nr:hypothetical protein [Deltaproteobacteria bacterium]MBT4526937.1 hypothetical protein [Deltaproteobacteria bacterium]